MIILDATSKSLIAKLSGAVATANPEFVVSYATTDGTAFTEGSNDGVLNGTAEVTLVSAPTAGTRMIVKDLVVCNLDTDNVTLLVQVANGASRRTVYKKLLVPDETFTFESAMEWKKVDHGELMGLGDDDHSQYYTPGRHTKTVHDDLNIDADTVDENHASEFAPASKGVDNGNSHDHADGDGAQVDHGGLGGLSDNDHAIYGRSGPYFAAHKGSDQENITSATDIKVTMPTEDADLDGTYDAANSKWTPGALGLYMIHAQASLAQVTDGYITRLVLYKNGSSLALSAYAAHSSNSEAGINASFLVSVDNVNDYFELCIWTTQPGDSLHITGVSTLTSWWGARLCRN